MSSKRSIPTEEDFARASAAMDEDYRGLGDVRKSILARFSKDGLHEAFLFYSRAQVFVAVLFFTTQKQIISCEQSGVTSRIKEAVREELEKVGRGRKDQLNIDFEIDSHESVQKNFSGNYLNRLR